MNEYPAIAEIERTAEAIRHAVVETPVWRWDTPEIDEVVGAGTEVHLKLELFQRTGTFKARGALVNALRLDADQRRRGITAVSAGNHAIAAAWAASVVGTSAKVVMLSGASRIRRARCEAYGAEVVLADDVHTAFEMVKAIERDEGRTLLHPFEGEGVALGTGTLGFEFHRQAGLDAAIVPIGGGGLCAGVAAALKQLDPGVRVYGVEPEGADTMSRSFARGEPVGIEAVHTIADSLGAPYAMPYSFGVCRRFVDAIVTVSDDELRAAMVRLFTGMKLAVEPAGAAATAALVGPLRERLAGQRVGLIVCGTNIGTADYASIVA
jgi:threonine dehydratase